MPRFFPLQWLEIYPFQIAARYPQRFAPFQPNFALESKTYIGELALMGNLPPTESRQAIRFTTDRLGFRTTPWNVPQNKPRILTIEGDSFTFGVALSDEETFPASLTRDLGVPVYNAGRFYTDPERLRELDWLLSRLELERPATIIYIMLEPFDLSLSRRHDQKAIDQFARGILGTETYTPLKEELRFLYRWYQLWWPVSPLRILTTRLYKRLCDDRILPNEYKQNVEERHLPDGTRFLLEPRFIRRYLEPPDDKTTRETADYLAWLGGELHTRNLDFWVLLVPESVSVYGPWLMPEASRTVAGRPHYLERLEQELSRRQVKVVNGLRIMRAVAPQDIATGELSYFREDHHWNPKGVRILSNAVAEALLRGGFQTAPAGRSTIASR